MAFPVISLARANRYLLRRQHLLEPCSDPLQAVADACGLQSQIPSTPAFSLRARVAGFGRADYDRLLVQERSLVRTWAMRETIHVVPSAQLPMYTRIYSEPAESPTPAMQKALLLLKEGPATRKQLTERAVAELGLSRAEAERYFGPWGGVLRHLAREALTVHMPAEGAEVPVVLTEAWLGAQPEPPARDALDDALLMAYAHGYGPVTLRDFAHFSLLTVERGKAALARLGAHLTEVRLEGSKLPHYLPTADLPELLATTGDEPAPVRLLPRFDSLVLAHKDKRRILDESLRRQVFKAAAVVEATVLIRGRVAGIWRAKSSTRELRFEFHPFGRQPVSQVRAEAGRLAKWLGLERLTFDVV